MLDLLISYNIYRVRQKNDPLAKRRYFDNRYVFLHNFCSAYIEIFSHVSTKFYCKVLMRSKVMNFLQKISKFQINQAYKTGIIVLSHLLKLSRDHCAHDLLA